LASRAVALFTAACALLGSAAAADRPNILWLLAEDMGPEALSSSGTPESRTPAIDQLARDGTRYTRAYTTAPVCSPSRSAFMTGMYATTIGAHHHRTRNKSALPEGVRILPDRLREAGYFTANVVKFPAGVAFKGTGKTDWNFKQEGPAFDGNEWAALKDHQPFYAQVNFQETHRTFHAPAEADPAKVVLPPYYPDHPVARKDWAAYLDAGRELDRKVARILALIEENGLAANTIVVFMGDNGQAHVRGKQFCYEEGLHVPLIVYWPKGISVPEGYTRGQVDGRFIEAIDLTASTLAWAGIAKPPGMQGKVFLGAGAEPPRDVVFGARDRCDETAMRIRSARDDRYRYIRNFTPEVPLLAPNAYKEKQYPVWNLLKELHAAGKLAPAQEALCQPRMPDEELYDLEADPHEIKNLAGSSAPEHQAALRKLRERLEGWIRETGDRLPDPDAGAPRPKAARLINRARPPAAALQKQP
jgi:arylsulfatase A-like enzyme